MIYLIKSGGFYVSQRAWCDAIRKHCADWVFCASCSSGQSRRRSQHTMTKIRLMNQVRIKMKRRKLSTRFFQVVCTRDNMSCRCDFDHSHRGSGSTPSNSYFLPPGVLPVLLYHFCGSTSYEYSQCLFFNSLGVVPQALYHFCGSTPIKVV